VATESARLGDRLAAVRHIVAGACRRAGRPVADVRVIAATKGVPVDVVAAARAVGLSDFGENYARELAEKAPAVASRWHFIGSLQRGTSTLVAVHADVVHTAAPGSGLTTLARRAHAAGRIIPTLIQVDFTGHRHGVSPEEVATFVDEAALLEGIRVVGLMTLAPPGPDAESARPFFAALRELRDTLAGTHPDLVELSMGMSLDYSVAVEEGATMVRVGTALFGPRPNAPR
jgi:pyridoxal phosphate enzyme (YggS family)